HITFNVLRYRKMINDYLFLNVHEIDLEEMWFQQNDATCHISTKKTLEFPIDLNRKSLMEKFMIG
ncbi:hypothetical protein NL500_29315, partial [Klebsiella pneumoniae]|nr:hypothetical protein [Klebsiella pneumoniae]